MIVKFLKILLILLSSYLKVILVRFLSRMEKWPIFWGSYRYDFGSFEISVKASFVVLNF